MKDPLAIVTMVYNEAVLLPVWLRHNARAVGHAHCHVVDHGSTDGSTDAGRMSGASVLRLPRSPQDDDRRSGFVNDLCGALLRYYEAVVYTDVDELLVVDPEAAPSLPAYAARLPQDAVITAIGLDVVHAPDEEPAMDWTGDIVPQRRWLRFSSAMCKPVMIRRRVDWAPGFHNIDDAPALGRLFLFHLRYADLPSGLARLERTRTQAWVTPQAGSHQRMPDTDWEAMLRGMAALPRDPDRSLRDDDPALRRWLDRLMLSAKGREAEQYRIDLHLSGDTLWRLPERFRF